MASISPQGAVTSDGRDPLIGATLADKFSISRRIGVGGMGTVYEGLHLATGRRCAIKVVLPSLLEDRVFLERFRREAEITGRLKNAHIAEVIEFDYLPNGAPYLAMEYLEGEDLSKRLRTQRALQPLDVRLIVDGIADALASAHAAGVLHRDIKPANLFLARQADGSEVVKLLDFGAAKDQGSNSQLTSTGQVIGSVWYVSPEQARGQELDPRTDQFSLAIAAFEALTGRRPFDAETPTETLFKIVSDAPPLVSSYNPALPAGLDAVLSRALAKRREERYPGVLEFADAFAAAVDPSHTPRFRAQAAAQPAADANQTLNKFPAFEESTTAPSVKLEPAAPAAAPALPPALAERRAADQKLVRELQNANLITLDGLRQGLEISQQVEPGFTADKLVELGLLDERALLRYLAREANLRYVTKDKVAAYKVSHEAIERLPAPKAEELWALPLVWDAKSGALTVITCDARPDLPTRVRAAAQGAQSVSVVLAMRSTVRAGLRKHYFSDLDAFRATLGRWSPPETKPPASGKVPSVTPARGAPMPPRATPLPGPAPASPPFTDDALAEALISAGAMERAAYDRVRVLTRTPGEDLADALLRLGALREQDFLRVVGAQFQTHTLTADKVAAIIAPQHLVDRLPAEEAEALCCFPFAQGGKGELHVVAGAPLHPELRARLRKATGAASIGVFAAAPGAVREAVQKWYHPEGAVLEGSLVLDDAAAEQANKTLIMGKVVDLPPPPPEELKGIAQAPQLGKEVQGLLPLERGREAMAVTILDAALSRFGAMRAALVLEPGRTWQRTASGDSQGALPRALVEQALAAGQAVLIPEASADSRLVTTEGLLARGVKSAACAPLHLADWQAALYLELPVGMTAEIEPRLIEFSDWAALRLADVEVVEGVRREMQQRAHLSRFLPPPLVDDAVRGGAELAPEGESAEVTLLAAELRGLVSLVAQQDPESTIAAVQRAITELVEVVHASGGGVHQLTGEGLVAIWGAAKSTGGPRQALAAAVAAQQKLTQPGVLAPGVSFALGVHAGKVTVGCVGSAERKVYITIGAAMPQVQRLCAMALDGQILVSEPVAVRAQAPGRKLVPVARLENLGQPVLAYQVG